MTITALTWGMLAGAIMTAIALATIMQSSLYCSMSA